VDQIDQQKTDLRITSIN